MTFEEWCKETGHSIFDGSVAAAYEAGSRAAAEEIVEIILDAIGTTSRTPLFDAAGEIRRKYDLD